MNEDGDILLFIIFYKTSSCSVFPFSLRNCGREFGLDSELDEGTDN